MFFNKTIKFIFLINIFLICFSKSEEQKGSIDINLKIFDQYPDYNNNFGDYAQVKVIKGIIQSPLDSSKIPKLTTNNVGGLQSPNLFSSWFASNFANKSKNSGLNAPLSTTIKLNLDTSTGLYVYDSGVNSFFLIDGKGFDTNSSFKNFKDGNGNYHNYHYCVSFNYQFTYSGNEKFNFKGNDDVWIFINNKLIVDDGGIHSPVNENIDLTQLSLAKGSVYPFDFFFCQRSSQSQPTFRIDTNINLQCKATDYCGVCGGDGGSCCNPSITCKTGEIEYPDGSMGDDLCTYDYCPSLDTKIYGTEPISAYCDHQPIPDPFKDESKCYVGACDSFTGIWSKNYTICPNRTNECLVHAPKNCDDVNGCQYLSTCTKVCDKGGNYCTNGTCISKGADDCALILEKDGKPDPCFVYSCNLVSGCTKTPLCKRSSDPCINNTCNAGKCTEVKLPPEQCTCECPQSNKCNIKTCTSISSCTVSDVPELNDGNLCTIDACDPETGNITHTLKSCGGCSVCNPTNGKCESKDSLCDDGNQCTTETCTASTDNADVGVCVIKPSNHCDKGDHCKIYTCSLDHGCNETERVCPDSGPCQIGYCDSSSGCKLKPRECHSDYFCIEATCDEKFGCVQFEKLCAPDNGNCQTGKCINNTAVGVNDGSCVSIDYDPKPFICKTAAVVSTAVVAGVVVAGAVALGAAIFAGKKGFDYWKSSQGNTMASSTANPLYQANNNNGVNPLYENPT